MPRALIAPGTPSVCPPTTTTLNVERGQLPADTVLRGAAWRSSARKFAAATATSADARMTPSRFAVCPTPIMPTPLYLKRRKISIHQDSHPAGRLDFVPRIGPILPLRLFA